VWFVTALLRVKVRLQTAPTLYHLVNQYRISKNPASFWEHPVSIFRHYCTATGCVDWLYGIPKRIKPKEDDVTTISRTLRTAILLTALLLTGCAALPPPPINSDVIQVGGESTAAESVTDPAALLGVEWRLAEIHPANAAVLMAGDPLQYTITFGDDGSFGGQLNCNRMSGTYELEGGKLTFGPIASTMAFCPEDNIAIPYTQALSSILSFAVVEGRLIVVYGPDGGELVYLPVAPVGAGELSAADVSPVVGLLWQLQAIQMMDGEILTPGKMDVYTLELSADGTANGQADCNRFGGGYTLEGSSLSFGPLNSTRAMCPEGSLYDRYMQGVGDANSFVLKDGHLFLAFGPDAGILEFAPASEISTSADVAEVDLANAVYAGICDEPVTLTDGGYAGEPFVAGGTSRPTATLPSDVTAVGDLNGDGMADGVAVLVENSGGSGSFVYLAAVLAEKDGLATGVTLLLGDRVRVESVAIVNGQIEVVAGTFADSDPMCCPSLRSRFTYALEKGALVDLSAEKL
jgi:heat shock protein HslJ